MSSNERGFTLVEAVVATLIMTVGLVSLAQMMAITIRMQMLGQNQTQAIRLAQDKLDQLMSQNFDDAAEIQVSGSNSLASNVANYFDAPVTVAPNGTAVTEYTRRWYVQAGPDSDGTGTPNPDLRLVTVRVIHNLDDRRTSAPVELMSVIRRW